MLTKKRTSFNDGMLKIVEQINDNSSFNAQINATKNNDLRVIKKLFYSVQTIRQQDIEFANEMGSSLNLKVKTRLDHSVSTHHKIIINHTLYDILQLDPDYGNKELYFYLEKERLLK